MCVLVNDFEKPQPGTSPASAVLEEAKPVVPKTAIADISVEVNQDSQFNVDEGTGFAIKNGEGQTIDAFGKDLFSRRFTRYPNDPSNELNFDFGGVKQVESKIEHLANGNAQINIKAYGADDQQVHDVSFQLNEKGQTLFEITRQRFGLTYDPPLVHPAQGMELATYEFLQENRQDVRSYLSAAAVLSRDPQNPDSIREFNNQHERLSSSISKALNLPEGEINLQYDPLRGQFEIYLSDKNYPSPLSVTYPDGADLPGDRRYEIEDRAEEVIKTIASQFDLSQWDLKEMGKSDDGTAYYLAEVGSGKTRLFAVDPEGQISEAKHAGDNPPSELYTNGKWVEIKVREEHLPLLDKNTKMHMNLDSYAHPEGEPMFLMKGSLGLANTFAFADGRSIEVPSGTFKEESADVYVGQKPSATNQNPTFAKTEGTWGLPTTTRLNLTPSLTAADGSVQYLWKF